MKSALIRIFAICAALANLAVPDSWGALSGKQTCDSVLDHLFATPNYIAASRQNVVESAFRTPDAQRASALDALATAHDDPAFAEISALARSKMSAEPLAAAERMGLPDIKNADATIIRRDALEFLVSESRENVDPRLTKAAIELLGSLPQADLTSLELLLPFARGARLSEVQAYKDAARAIQRISTTNREIPDFYISRRNMSSSGSKLSKELQAATVISVSPVELGNNVNTALIVTLETTRGRKLRGIFKPFLGEQSMISGAAQPANFTREVQASDFFSEYLSHPQIFVPETLEATVKHEGKSYGVGSFQVFAEGKKNLSAWYSSDGRPITNWKEYSKIWNKQRQDPRWKDLESWIRTYDWLIGNPDRFPNSLFRAGNPNNLMISEVAGPGSALEVALIDNSSGRHWRKAFRFSKQDLPSLKKMPPSLKQKLLSIDESTLRRLRFEYQDAFSREEIDEFITRIRTLREYVKSNRWEWRLNPLHWRTIKP